jgi:hypothetical protein
METYGIAKKVKTRRKRNPTGEIGWYTLKSYYLAPTKENRKFD